MEVTSLYLVIACLLVGSVCGHEANSLYFGCQWNNDHFLSCRSAGITTLADVFFLEQQIRNVTSSNHLQGYRRTTKHIDLSYNMMSTLHLNVFYKFVFLETLNISNNQIYKVSIDKSGNQHEKGTFLTSLQTFVLNGNRLVAIPKGLCKLKSLHTLSLSANRILYIQRDDFANCTNLQHIHLGENRISSIHPDAFRDLRNLQVLQLNSNTLVTLSPLVFLFKHILKADIDLSENLWACDCNLQPLKYLISSLPVAVRKPWNVTCATPFSKAGQHILSIENSKSCPTSDSSYVYDKTLIIPAGEEAFLDCETSNQLSNKDVLWWSPQGIILKERHNTNYYLSNTNSLILDQPDNSDKGIYVCLTNVARITYHVDIQENNQKSIRRSPRDLQVKNVRMQTQYSFDLAVSLSVILTFLIAFFLGVFIRPYLENLWRKWCKSQYSEPQHSGAVYDNEGFTADYTTRKQGGNSNVSSLPQYNTGQTLEHPDEYKLEAESFTQERAIDVQFPTNNAVLETRENITHLPKTKRVKWASDEDFSPNVNLKYLMSLIKPINFIASESSMSDTVHAHQSYNTNSENFDSINGYYNAGYSSDEGSSFSLGSEYDVSDDDSIINTVLQETKQGRQDNNDDVNLMVNLSHVMSLLKPVHFIVPDSTVPSIVKSPTQKQFFPLSTSTYPVNRIKNMTEQPSKNHQDSISKHKKNKYSTKPLYDTSSSEESFIYAFDSEKELSDEDDLLNFNVLGTKKSKRASNEISSPTINLKYNISLLKPINIIVPESITTRIVESSKPGQFYPLTKYPENTMEDLEYFTHNYDQDKRITIDHNGPQLHNTSGIHYSVAPNDSSSTDQESNISVDSEHYCSAEDAFTDSYFLKNQTRLNNETLSPTVNLKYVISLLKPISITFPDSTTPKVNENSTQHQFFPVSLPRYPENRKDIADISSSDEDNSIPVEKSKYHLQSIDPGNQYSDPIKAKEINQQLYDSSSSEDSSNDNDDSNKDRTLSPFVYKPLPRPRGSNANVYPTVNLRQIISTLKPIQIKVPDESHYSNTIMSPREDFKVTSQKLYSYSSSDEHSSDSVDSDHDSSNIIVTKPSAVPVPTPRRRTGSEKVYPTVNLRYIMSSFKPIHINVPDSTQYLDVPVIPKKHTEVLQTQYDFSSSESSNSSDSEHEGSNEEVTIRSNVSEPLPGELKIYENQSPVVNLKYIISSLKPVNIIVPDTTQYSDLLVSSDKNREVTYDSSSSDEEFKSVIRGPSLLKPTLTEWESNEDFYPTVNLKQIICTLNPIKIRAQSLSAQKNTEVNIPLLYDNSSSTESSDDSEYDFSDEDVRSQPNLTKEIPDDWERSQNVYPTVNLKYVISLLKPFHVKVPDSTHYSDTQVCLKNNMGVTQKKTDSTSSDESSNGPLDSEYESSDEEVIRTPAFLAPKPIEWATTEDNTLRVTLRQVMSLIKPLYFTVSETTSNSDIPVKDTDVTQKLYDFSSTESCNESSVSEDEGSVEEALQSANMPGSRTELKEHDYSSTTVNLKHVISLLNPIYIKVPDTVQYSNIILQPNTEVDHEMYESTSSDESSDDSNEEIILKSALPEQIAPERTTTENLGPIVNLRHVISLLKPIKVKLPEQYSDTFISPKKNTEVTTPRLHDYSSSDESSNDSDDSQHRNSSLPIIIPTTIEINKNLNPTVDLKSIIYFFKPLHITVSDSTEYTSFPINPNNNTNGTQKLYILSDESSNDSVSSDEDVTNRSCITEKKKEIISKLSNSSLSDEDSNKSSDLDSDEEMRRIAILHKPVLNESATNGNDYATINLKHAISSLKPMHFAVSDSTYYSGTPVHSEINVEKVTQNLYYDISSDENSNDSSDSGHEGLDEEVIIHLAKPPTTDWQSSKNLIPTVNLKHVMSSLKPICIVVADYSTMTTVVTPKRYDSSSSDESSNASDDSEYESSYKHLMGLPILKPMQKRQESNENVCPTVNLKHAISLIKPLQIKVPDTTHYSDIPISSKGNIEIITQKPDYSSSDESSNDSVGSEHKSSHEDAIQSTNIPKLIPITWASNENLNPTVNLRHIMSTFKPLSVSVSDSIKTPGILKSTNTDTEVMQKLDSSTLSKTFDSDDFDSESSEDVIISTLPKQGSTQLAVNEKVHPTVNLKYVISLLKPIHIKLPDSTNYSFVIPSESVHVSKKHYTNSSSDESSAESGHEGFYEITNNMVDITGSTDSSDSSDSDLEDPHGDILLTKHSTLPKSTPTEWARNEDLSPTVSLRQITALIKPINIKVQDQPFHSDAIKTQKKNIEVTQKYDDTSSDSEHENSYIYVTKVTPTERERNENAYPTVNFKHVLSVLKPIQIRLPDTNQYEDTLINPKTNIEVTSKTISDIRLSNDLSNNSAVSEHESIGEYMIGTTEWTRNKHDYPTVNLKQVTSLLKPIQFKVPDSIYYSNTFRSPKTIPKHFDKRSSDESSTDSEHEYSDENIISSNTGKPMLREWTNNEMVNPTVKPQNITTLPKPVNITAEEYPVPEAVKRPKWKPFSLTSTSRYKEHQDDDYDKNEPITHPKSQLYNKNSKHHHSYTFKTPSKDSNVILTSYKKKSLDNTSDIDEWGHKDVNRGDAMNSDILKLKVAAHTNNEDALVVNLKQVMALVKPVSIIDPELPMIKQVKIPPPVPPRKFRKSLQEQSSFSFDEKPMTSRFPVQHSAVSRDSSQSDWIKLYMDSREEAALYYTPATRTHDKNK